MNSDAFHIGATASVVREDETTPVPEKVIRCVWNDQLLDTSQLKTTEGRDLEIVFPGYWNFGSGPDFQNATIRIDGELLEGDVELHVFGCDWKSHGHSNNNEFDNVILHVFLWAERNPAAPTRKQSRPHIHELELKSFLKHGLLKLNEQFDFDSYPVLNPFNTGRCHQPLSQLSGDQLSQLLDAAGDARLQTKMNRFHDRVIAQGYEQTFYEGVAEALGYPGNKLPFRTLAEHLPMDLLHALTPAKATNEERVINLQALMFGVSGLIDFPTLDLSVFAPGDQFYFQEMKRIWDRHADRLEDRLMNPRDWKFGKMRPANFPYRRVAGLARLITSHSKPGIFGNFLKAVESAPSAPDQSELPFQARKRLLNFFCVDAEEYWTRHYTPGGKTLQRDQQLIGAERSREIVINIALPLGLIFAQASKSERLESTLQNVFQSPNRAADNKLLRFMKHYIFGNQESMMEQLKTDKQAQGLLQIYQEFCTRNENNCMRCTFPDQVRALTGQAK